MKYHLWRVLSKHRPYQGRTILSENIYCDVCWNKEIKSQFEAKQASYPTREQHIELEAPDDNRCDECRPLNI